MQLYLKACDDGISNKIEPGKPESRNIYEAQKAGKDVKKLPLSLGEALERLSEDKVFNLQCLMKCIKYFIGIKMMNGKNF